MPSEPSPDRLPEPRSENCPWCGSPRLRTRPGTPRAYGPHDPRGVDECRDCAHAFRAPRPGRTEPAADRPGRTAPEPSAGRARAARRHRAAARAMLHLPEPESWLDVGTGHAHFPETARELFAYTAFDGLDTTPRVIGARAAGRIEEAHVGELTDPRITALLHRRYDVVSMFRHLEHTPDPRAELRAALAVLRPGGHLLLEVPDPRSAFGALRDRLRPPHGRTRPLHLIPPDNLRAELEAQGCTLVPPARTPYNLRAVLLPLLGRPLPKPPRRAPVPPAAATAPATALPDRSPLPGRPGLLGTYRVIARKAES